MFLEGLCCTFRDAYRPKAVLLSTLEREFLDSALLTSLVLDYLGQFTVGVLTYFPYIVSCWKLSAGLLVTATQ